MDSEVRELIGVALLCILMIALGIWLAWMLKIRSEIVAKKCMFNAFVRGMQEGESFYKVNSINATNEAIILYYVNVINKSNSKMKKIYWWELC